jgi:hypothetical protein
MMLKFIVLVRKKAKEGVVYLLSRSGHQKNFGNE